MADPIGNLVRELASAALGYKIGRTKERLREAGLIEREQARYELAQLRRLKAELRKDQIDRVANKVYARLLAKLAGADLVSTHPLFTGKAFPLRDLIGMGPLAQFALQVSECVRTELKQQP